MHIFKRLGILTFLLLVIALAGCSIDNDRHISQDSSTKQESAEKHTEQTPERNTGDSDLGNSDFGNSDLGNSDFGNSSSGNSDSEDFPSGTVTEEATEKPVHFHDFGEWQEIKPATCSESGIEKRYCTCGKSESRELEAEGHIEEIDPPRSPTCIKWGCTEGKHCSVCQTVLVPQEWITFLGHSFVGNECERCHTPKPSEGLEYHYYGNPDDANPTCAVIGIGTCTDTNIIIPDITSDGYRVTDIGSKAFYNCSSIESVFISSTVEIIGSQAFFGCDQLKSVTIEENNNLFLIDEKAFSSCKNLANITIPQGVTPLEIRYYTFGDCESLETIVLPDTMYSISLEAFFNCKSLKTIVIPGGLTSISQKTFENCESLTNVTISDSITWIHERAFYNCASLSTITFGENSELKRIGENAFYGCAFQSIDLPDSVIDISAYAFSNCTKLSNIRIPKGVTTIASRTFFNCNRLTDITIPENVILIEDDAFFRCTNLLQTENGVSYVDKWAVDYEEGITEITLREGTVGIACYAFSDVDTLKKVFLPDSVRYINDRAFYLCPELTSVTFGENSTLERIGSQVFNSKLAAIDIPDSVKHVGHYAFDSRSEFVERENGILYVDNWVIGCVPGLTHAKLREDTVGIAAWVFGGEEKLLGIELPEGLRYICEAAFRSCEGLETVIIPSSVISIGDYSFYGCYALNKVATSNGLLAIGDYAFAYCQSLGGIEIPNSVTHIGESAFIGCLRLKNVTIPDSVTHLGACVFYGCRGLEKVTLPSNITIIDEGLFYECESLKAIIVPDNVTSIGYKAFYFCEDLEKLVLPAGVIMIGDEALHGCTDLAITYGGTQEQWKAIYRNWWNDYDEIETIIHCIDGDYVDIGWA